MWQYREHYIVGITPELTSAKQNLAMEQNDFDAMIGEIDSLTFEETSQKLRRSMLAVKSEARLLRKKVRGIKLDSTELSSELEADATQLRAAIFDVRAEAAQLRADAAQLRAASAQVRADTAQAEAVTIRIEDGHSNATAAQTRADRAQDRADEAQDRADEAQDWADMARRKADELSNPTRAIMAQ